MTGFRSRLAAMMGAALSVPAFAAPMATLALPASVTYPEGTTYDPASNSLFAGSSVDGALVRVDATTGKVTPVTPPGRIVPAGAPFPAMLGMKLDRAGRLWIAGGNAGLVTVVDPRSGRLLKQVKVPTAPKTQLNDLVLIGQDAYVTDTFVPILWRMHMTGNAIGDPEPWLDLKGTPIAFTDGPNLNGIAATPDGRTIIVVQMNKGLLFRIDVASKRVTAIDIGRSDLTGTDGLVLDGRTLYVVRQWAGEVVTFALDADLGRATETARLKTPELRWPATAAKVGGNLVVVNTQMNRHDTHDAVAPFTLVKVPLTALRAAH